MWIFSLLLAALFYFLVYIKHKRRGLVKGMVSVPILPILIRNALDLLNVGPEAIFNLLEQFFRKYGDRFSLQTIYKHYVVNANPEDIKVILTNSKITHKSEDYNFFSQWLGTGLLISNEAKWFSRRKILTPAFHFKILDDFVHVFDKQSDTLVKVLSKRVNQDEFNVCQAVTLYTLDVICEAAMGVKVDAQTHSESLYVRSVVEISAILYWRIFNAFARLEWFWKWTTKSKRHDELVNIIHNFTNGVIEARRVEISKKACTVEAKNEDDFGERKKFALLDLLLQTTVNGEHLSNDDIREEVDNFMFAGHDTTTSAIEFLLYNIARFPEVQQKLFEEVRRVFGDDLEEPTDLWKLNELSYLDLCMKESLRIFSPVPYIVRRMTEDIEINGVVYPSNVNVCIAIYLMHKNPKYFPEPEKFIPERFDVVESAEKRNPFTYIPFAAGSRNCIGQRFAQYEIKSVISKLLRNFEIHLGHEGFEPRLTAELILKPANGIWIKLKPRIYD